MSNNTRVKINLHEGTIELEGSEDFVSRYLDEFKGLISYKGAPHTKDKIETKEPIKSERKKEGAQLKKGTKPPKVGIEEFDVKAKKDKPALKEFFDSKNPQREKGRERIVVIAYYITHHAKIEEFSEGHVEFAFKMLDLPNRPVHLRQALIDTKNKNGWVEFAETEGKWKLSRFGEIFVEDKLPSKSENK
ncbi:MAG TPA: hypothetical protein VJZ16_05460 [Syntrophales bacterium]|nr:hypothetical protein [Syntrophales bacterium]